VSVFVIEHHIPALRIRNNVPVGSLKNPDFPKKTTGFLSNFLGVLCASKTTDQLQDAF